MNTEFPKSFKVIFSTHFPDRTKPLEEEKELIKKELEAML
jgi:hypothetical protein